MVSLILTSLTSEQISCKLRGRYTEGAEKRWSAYKASEDYFTGITVSKMSWDAFLVMCFYFEFNIYK